MSFLSFLVDSYYFFILFLIVIITQIFYYLFFFIKLSKYKEADQANLQVDKNVTVIVCAKNEAINLSQFLPAILLQETNFKLEIIVVNDNSDDNSNYILEEFRKEFSNLNVIYLNQEAKMIIGKKFPLSIGIKSAKNEIIVLTDADCLPATEHWVSNLQKKFSGDIEIVLGYGKYFKKKGFLNKCIRFETFHTALQYLSYCLAGIPYMGVGRNLAYKKSLFIKNKGFSSINNIPSGDDDLFINQVANKNNTTISINHEAHTFSEPKTSWKTWLNQKYRHYTTAKYYQPKHKFLLGLYSITLFLVFPLLIGNLLVYHSLFFLIVGIYLFKLIIQGFIYYPCMKKLNESDLFKLIFFQDILYFIYYLITSKSLWKKPTKNWR